MEESTATVLFFINKTIIKFESDTTVIGLISNRFLGIYTHGPRIPLHWSTKHSNGMKKADLLQQLLVTYGCTTESTLTYCISVWYINCTATDRKALQWVISRGSVGHRSTPWRTSTAHGSSERLSASANTPHAHAMVCLNSFHLADVTRTSMPAPPDGEIVFFPPEP